eukprot:6397772-Pyramimonas_sp.AAC.1
MRLVWWTGVVRPAFPDLMKQKPPNGDGEGGGPKCDPSRLVRAVVFGRVNFEGPRHKEVNSLWGLL